jgi:uncharacterized protein YkwD
MDMLRKICRPLAWYTAVLSAVMLGCATPNPSPKASAPGKDAQTNAVPANAGPPKSPPAVSVPAQRAPALSAPAQRAPALSAPAQRTPTESAPAQNNSPENAPIASVPAPAPAPPAGNADAAPTPAMRANSEEKEVLVQTNAFRREHGLSMLRAESRLMQAAKRHAANMARKDRFGDTDKNGHVMDGLDPGDRVQVSGYSFSLVAENVGWQLGKSDPVASMVEGWKNSPGHRKNLLIPEMSDTGVGVAKGQSGRWYFVQVFGKPFESTKRATSRKVALSD